MTYDLERIGADPESGRPFLMLEGSDPSRWDVGAADLELFTLLLAIDGDLYSDAVLTSLASLTPDVGRSEASNRPT